MKVNSAFFMGGVPKNNVLTAFRASIFFDDQDLHLASSSVPAAKVPYTTGADHESGDRGAENSPKQSSKLLKTRRNRK